MFKNILFITIALSLSSVANSFEFSNQDSAIPSEKAFKVFVEREGNNLSILFDTEKDYYLYKDKIEFIIDNQPISVEMPDGFMKDDNYFGIVEIYPLDFKVNINQEEIKDANEITIKHQGCAGVYDLCYIPRIDVFKI